MPPKEEGIVSKIASWFKRPKPKTPIKGFGVRIKNIAKVHWRGLLGWILPLIIFPVMLEKENNAVKTKLMWIIMAWWFLIRPVNIPVTGLVPIFYAPMMGIMETVGICSCYMNDSIMLFLLAGILLLLLNNSGVDRRVILKILTSGDVNQYTARKMVYKCSTAAFFMSILSSRLITTSIVTEYFTTTMMSVEAKYGRYKTEADLKSIRYVVNTAIQTSSAIGSLALIHSSFATLCFRAIFHESVPSKAEYPDIFNYLQYSAFAVPVVTIMFVVNLGYNLVLVQKLAKRPMSKGSKEHLKKLLSDKKKEVPSKFSSHEIMTIIFTAVFLIFHLFRWSYWLGGWAAFSFEPMSEPEPQVPAVKDATGSAILVVLLHILPTSINFLKYFTVSKRSALPPPKMESSVLWWKFVDKNLNYGYFFLIGSGVAIITLANHSKLCDDISAGCGGNITSLGWTIGVLIMIIIGSILGNIISGTAACVIFLPFVICSASKAEAPWPGLTYLAALAVGMSSSFGFTYPYQYTPAYFCYYVGKVPMKKMITYSIMSVVICILILWLAIAFYAPMIWDPQGTGVHFILGEVTTEATTAGADDSATPAPEDRR